MMDRTFQKIKCNSKTDTQTEETLYFSCLFTYLKCASVNWILTRFKIPEKSLNISSSL